jgi:hypothetical protein
VAHAQKVQLISKSNRKDDRHDARTLARLAILCRRFFRTCHYEKLYIRLDFPFDRQPTSYSSAASERPNGYTRLALFGPPAPHSCVSTSSPKKSMLPLALNTDLLEIHTIS